MSVEVLYFAELKELTGSEKERFTLSPLNIKELVETILKKYKSMRNMIWNDDTNNIKKSISIAINEKVIKQVDKLSISLSEGDRVAFLLPISGG